MTLANVITLFRIALIPCFITAALYYAHGVKHGEPLEWHRWLAVIFYTVATITDGIDGFVARRMHQQTRLGSILDPLADKALLLSALVLLSFNPGDAFEQLPLWFPIVIVSRDVVVVIGVAIVFMMGRGFDVRPHWIGKVATLLQMITIGVILIKLPYSFVFVWSAGITTMISGIIYVIQGMKKLNS